MGGRLPPWSMPHMLKVKLCFHAEWRREFTPDACQSPPCRECKRVFTCVCVAPPGRGTRDHRASSAKTLVEGGPSAEDSFLHSAEESGSALGGGTGCDPAGEVGRGGSAYVVCFAPMGRLRRSPVAEISHQFFICWALRMLFSL